MVLKEIFRVLLCIVFGVALVSGRGLLMLYRPLDISTECAFSRHLRFDISYGGGMSDTITLVLRTLAEIDYECEIEIVSERHDKIPQIVLIIVVRFPNTFDSICERNHKAIMILKKYECYFLCNQIEERFLNDSYYVSISLTRFRFAFTSNSRINTDLNANVYEVTATSARSKRKNETCNKNNETACIIRGDEYCLTSGIVCDGIKNCGVEDWFDERKSECETPIHRMTVTPVGAVITMIVCCTLIVIHLLRHCLPPLAASFFIFNTNEDNRLCIDPLFKPHTDGLPTDMTAEYNRRKSLIPVDLSTTSSDTDNDSQTLQRMIDMSMVSLHTDTSVQISTMEKSPQSRKGTIRTISQRITERLRSITGRTQQSVDESRAHTSPPPPPPHAQMRARAQSRLLHSIEDLNITTEDDTDISDRR